MPGHNSGSEVLHYPAPFPTPAVRRGRRRRRHGPAPRGHPDRVPESQILSHSGSPASRVPNSRGTRVRGESRDRPQNVRVLTGLGRPGRCPRGPESPAKGRKGPGDRCPGPGRRGVSPPRHRWTRQSRRQSTRYAGDGAVSDSCPSTPGRRGVGPAGGWGRPGPRRGRGGSCGSYWRTPGYTPG